jgi:DNA-binding transcriptional MerR regulator
MSTAAAKREGREQQAPKQRLHTIGAVCRSLQADFPEISISKIRYLEEQGLLTPKRTRGGYRLFGEDDVERLRTILELQRDEFLPLRVIRQELASPTSKERRRRRAAGLTGREEEFDAAELAERAEVSPSLVRELEEYGVLSPRVEDGERRYGESDADIARTCAALAQYGIAPRHLRTIKTGTDRAAGLLESVVAPALRARSPERRQAGVEDLETLGELSQDLLQLLLWRELRNFAAPAR